ncbi:MAG: S-layer homology domain-containing protein, partial [Oscillospiraceae bacterium]|nr:S-layer homology domain-containing protein [Oscillospiraceae bacterium]
MGCPPFFIVTYMLIGSYAAERLTPTPSFSDVPASHWASKYVAYAFQAGIVAGFGDDSFRPDELLTGSQVAKLMNTVLG